MANHQWKESSKTPHLGCYETNVQGYNQSFTQYLLIFCGSRVGFSPDVRYRHQCIRRSCPRNITHDHQSRRGISTILRCHSTIYGVTQITSYKQAVQWALIGITTGYPINPSEPYHFEPDHWSHVKSGWYVKSVTACCMSHYNHSQSFQSSD